MVGIEKSTSNMAANTLLQGSLPAPRLYSVSFSLPGKWSAVIQGDFLGTSVPSDPDTSLLPNLGASNGWVLVSKEKITSNGFEGTINYNYQNIGSILKSPTEDRDPTLYGYVYSVEVTLRLDPISMHPNIGELKKKYKGILNEGDWTWPVQDPTNSSGRSATDANGNPVINVNPMYNVQEYLVPGVVFKKTSTLNASSIPTTQLTKLGQLDTPSPNPFGFVTGTRGSGVNAVGPWLKTEASASLHGDGLVITEAWMYGGIGGWNANIYDPYANAGGFGG